MVVLANRNSGMLIPFDLPFKCIKVHFAPTRAYLTTQFQIEMVCFPLYFIYGKEKCLLFLVSYLLVLCISACTVIANCGFSSQYQSTANCDFSSKYQSIQCEVVITV